MILAQPENSRRDQELADLIASEVKDQRAPLGVFALPWVSMFVQCGAIELRQAMSVAREVGRYPVHNHANSSLVASIHEVPEVVRIPKAGRGRKVPNHLITPGPAERMLHYGQQFNVGVAQTFHITDQIDCQFPVAQGRAIFMPLPRTQM